MRTLIWSSDESSESEVDDEHQQSDPECDQRPLVIVADGKLGLYGERSDAWITIDEDHALDVGGGRHD